MAEKFNILFCLEIWGTWLGFWGLARTPPFPLPSILLSCQEVYQAMSWLPAHLLPRATSGSGVLGLWYYTLGGRTSILLLFPQPLLGSVGTLVPVVWPSNHW